MKYQIVVTNGHVVVRLCRFFRSSEYLRHATGEVVEFESEEAAVNAILARTGCAYSYAGAVIREIKTEEYNNY